MRAITGLTIVVFTVLALAGCNRTAGDNTSYDNPPVRGGVAIPLN